MKVVIAVVLSFLAVNAAAFSTIPRASRTQSQQQTPTFLQSARDDKEQAFERLRPETSFGSEAVPEAQRPVNEYLDVTSQPLFGWAKSTSGLLVRLVILYAALFGLVCYPISSATYTQEGFLLQKVAASNVGAMAILCIVMVRIYSGWNYIGQRLTSKLIEYEETGWYDGDVEQKTETELRRDRMLYTSDVKPVLNRLKVFSVSVAGLAVSAVLAFNVASSYKPLFDQYDPSMLERLRYDDNLADKAAQNAAAKPAYCDSRYYRAIANGGQGC